MRYWSVLRDRRTSDDAPSGAAVHGGRINQERRRECSACNGQERVIIIVS
jgi:hypothetical protein